MNKIETDIVTVSIPYRKFLMSRLQAAGYKNDIGVVELGVDTSEFVESNNQNKSIIFTGSLEERKNIKFLLKVFAKIQAHDDYSLTLVGDGPQTKELISYVDKNNIEKVKFLGRLSYEAVIKELPKHQYYMHTSSKESFSYSLLQAKLSGLVTIAYGGLEVPNEFIDIKMDSFEIDEWAEKILKIDAVNSNFDREKYSYQVTAKNTLEKIK